MDPMPFMWALWLCQCAQTSAAVLLAGTAALRLLAWGTGLECSSAWTRLAWTSWSLLLGAALLQLGLTAADMSGLPLAQACSGQVLGSVLGSTVFGAVWKARLCLLAATLVIGWRLGAAPRVDNPHPDECLPGCCRRVAGRGPAVHVGLERPCPCVEPTRVAAAGGPVARHCRRSLAGRTAAAGAAAGAGRAATRAGFLRS